MFFYLITIQPFTIIPSLTFSLFELAIFDSCAASSAQIRWKMEKGKKLASSILYLILLFSSPPTPLSPVLLFYYLQSIYFYLLLAYIPYSILKCCVNKKRYYWIHGIALIFYSVQLWKCAEKNKKKSILRPLIFSVLLHWASNFSLLTTAFESQLNCIDLTRF